MSRIRLHITAKGHFSFAHIYMMCHVQNRSVCVPFLALFCYIAMHNSVSAPWKRWYSEWMHYCVSFAELSDGLEVALFHKLIRHSVCPLTLHHKIQPFNIINYCRETAIARKCSLFFIFCAYSRRLTHAFHQNCMSFVFNLFRLYHIKS